MAAAGSYYQESGRVPPRALARLLATGLGTATVWGLLYGALTGFSQLALLDVLACWMLGAHLGTSLVEPARRGKIRNRLVVAGLAFLRGVWVEYVAIVVHVYVASGRDFLVTDPEALHYLFTRAADSGAGQAVHLYLLLLLVEGAILAGRAAVKVGDALENRPFCEDCEVWLEPQPGECFLRGPVEVPVELRRALRQDPQAAVAALAPYDPARRDWTRFTLVGCPECGESLYLWVHKGKTKALRSGGTTSESRPIVEGQVLTPEQFDDLFELCEGEAA